MIKSKTVLYITLGLLALGVFGGAAFFVKDKKERLSFLHEIHQQKERLYVLSDMDKTYEFDVEIAATPEKMAEGLMFRQELAERAGMLFIFNPEREARMWMKNTFIPLDMVFIDRQGTITGIHEGAMPHSMTVIRSGHPVYAVLEINAGLVKKLGIKKGSRVKSSVFQE